MKPVLFFISLRNSNSLLLNNKKYWWLVICKIYIIRHNLKDLLLMSWVNYLYPWNIRKQSKEQLKYILYELKNSNLWISFNAHFNSWRIQHVKRDDFNMSKRKEGNINVAHRLKIRKNSKTVLSQLLWFLNRDFIY